MILLEINPKTKIGLFVHDEKEIIRLNPNSYPALAKGKIRFGIYRLNNYKKDSPIYKGGLDVPHHGQSMALISNHETLAEAYVNFNKIHKYPLIILSGNRIKEKLVIGSIINPITKQEVYKPILEIKYSLKEGAYESIGEVNLRNQLIESFKAHLNSEYGFDGIEDELNNNDLPRLKKPGSN